MSPQSGRFIGSNRSHMVANVIFNLKIGTTLLHCRLVETVEGKRNNRGNESCCNAKFACMINTSCYMSASDCWELG